MKLLAVPNVNFNPYCGQKHQKNTQEQKAWSTELRISADILAYLPTFFLAYLLIWGTLPAEARG